MTTERFSNAASTTLASPLGAGDLSISVQGTVHFPIQPEFRIRVGQELMLVIGVAGTTWTVTRGIEGTNALPHAARTSVVGVLTAGALDELRAEIEAEDRTASGIRTASTVVAVSAATAPTVGQVLTATSGTAADWETLIGDTITAPRIPLNGSTTSNVGLTTNNWTPVMPVTFNGIGLELSSIYITTVTFTCTIWKTSSMSVCGKFRLVADLTIRTNQLGQVLCSFPDSAQGNSAPLLETPLEGAELDLIQSTNGVTLRAIRPAGVACTVSAEWATNSFNRLGFAPDYPQVGEWGTGDIWIADDAVLSGSNVTSIAGRESGLVMTPSGGTFTSEVDPLTGTRVLVGDTSAVLTATNPTLLAGFDGVRTPNIVFVQFTSRHTRVSNWIIEVTDSSTNSRVIQINWSFGDFYGVYRVSQSSYIVDSFTNPVDTKVTVVACLHTDGKLYIVSPAGTSPGLADTTTPGLTGIDRVKVGNSGDKLRRWGLRLSDNPLADSIDIYQELVLMP